MLNKNDPLIAAVQKIMQGNQSERNAVKLVNEKFGITDRRALPSNRQAEWDSAYKTILSEGVISEDELNDKGKGPHKKATLYRDKKSGKEINSVKHPGEGWEVVKEGLHPNQQKLDVHEPEKDELTSKDFKELRAMKEQNAPKTDPYAENDSGTYTTPPREMTAAEKPKPTSVTPSDQSALTKKVKDVLKEKITKSTSAGKVISDFVHSDNPKFAGKSKTERTKMALGAYYSKHPEKSKKVNEGFNNRHGLSVTASADQQAVAELNEAGGVNLQKSKLAPMHTQGIKQTRARLAREPSEPKRTIGQRAAEIGRGVEAGLRGAAAGATDYTGLGIGSKPLSQYATDFITPGREENLKKEFPRVSSVSQSAGEVGSVFTGAGLTKGIVKQGSKFLPKLKKIDTALDTTKAVKKDTGIVPKIERGTGQGNRLAAPKRSEQGPWGSARPPEVKPVSARPAPSGTMLARLQQSRQAAQTSRAGGSTVGATQAANRAKMAQQASGVRTGGSTVAATQSATRAQNLAQTARDIRAGAGRVVAGTANAVRKYPKLAAGAAAGVALGGFAATKLTNKPEPATADTGPEKIKTSTQTTTTAGKVTDRDIMNDPRYKQAVKSAGGEKGARKIAVGRNIEPVGKFSKGETIWGKVKGQLEKERSQTQTSTTVQGGQGIAAIPGGASSMAKPAAPAPASGATRMTNPTQRPYDSSTSPTNKTPPKPLSGGAGR